MLFKSYRVNTYRANNPVMYRDPDGDSFIVAIIIILATVGATAGGIITYNAFKDAGYSGWELAGYTALGTIAGGLSGGLLGYAIGAISLATLTIPYGIGMMGSGAVAMTTTYITISGAQLAGVAVIGGTIAGSYYLYSKKSSRDINQAAREAGIPKEFRGEFGKYVEFRKGKLGLGPADHSKYQTIRKWAYNFFKLIAKKIR